MLKRLIQSENLAKYLAAAVLLFVILYPKFPLLTVPGTYVSIRLEDVLMAVTGLFAFFYLVKNKELIKNPIIASIALYLAVGLLSVVSAIVLSRTVDWHIGILHFLRRVEYFVPFILGISLYKKRNESTLSFILFTIAITIIFVFIYGFGQRYFQWPIIVTQNFEYSKGVALRWVAGSHINSTFAGHYDLATFLVLVSPFLVALGFSNIKMQYKTFFLGTFALSLWLMVAAVSRVSVVAFLISITIAMVLLRKFKELAVVVAVCLVVFAFSPDLLARYQRVIDVTRNGIKKVLTTEFPIKVVYAQSDKKDDSNIDVSSSIRFNVEWPRAIRAIQKNPLLGTGYSSITLATDNDYLRALGETGLMGLSAFGLIFLRLLNLFWRGFKNLHKATTAEKAFLAGIFGGFLTIFLSALFIDVFESSKFAIVYWLLIGLTVSVTQRVISEDQLEA